ncbi:hypothetical protein [Falsiruegeria mediterranea]
MKKAVYGKRTSTVIRPQTYDKLADIAEAKDVTVSVVIRWALQEYLDRQVAA